ncbi:hypothetical protein PoB_000515300 [Plakobranchus ocellatus]|uniref:Uncharacterized protein n=1 Tax=Plakobranchus ocellatus TaxID=259542 RepID=A0AAV3Y820_9GAST|nr:hypothetical protein PoB_000515300 [Plakobranchus ocellatus]
MSPYGWQAYQTSSALNSPGGETQHAPPPPPPPHPFTLNVLVTEGVKSKKIKGLAGQATNKNGTSFSEIDLNTGLHAATASISLEKTLTCTLNLPPNIQFRKVLSLNSLSTLQSLFSCWVISTRILLRGGGEGDVEDFIAKNDRIILNSG